MAQIVIEVRDDAYERVVDALCEMYSYSEDQGTKENFAACQVARMVKGVVVNFESSKWAYQNADNSTMVELPPPIT